MEVSKVTALLLISMLFISSATPILACGSCGKPSHKPKKPTPKPPVTVPPITLPPVVKPPVPIPPITLPPVVKPPVPIPPITLPPVVKPPVTVPPITLPPVVKPPVPIPPITLPPVVKPPVTVPPITLPPVVTPVTPGPAKPCPPAAATCPIDTLKLGACVDLLGGLVHVGLGDPAVNECCPILKGLVELEAAACLCTTLKIKALNLSIYVPLALQLLVTCGKTPPPGYTCAL
ncbi:PREDICTED: 36.4 kDa proline-rich protein-like isoform X2 [Ipomoea nil]|uniref:36.4 kDa proline-rich protein-like isoform X2 n=1 Tax=Ipomoea nil TaxID=35883 RepID=UPI000901218F|nr:PREDICTED: 36.4 kDa proline-rich protein-like isoform X2 [Ipomoea nil]